jgi:primosomal protein N' (replication factor Y)
MPLAASVLIDGPSELVFDYAIPDQLKILPGCRVRIPFGTATLRGPSSASKKHLNPNSTSVTSPASSIQNH